MVPLPAVSDLCDCARFGAFWQCHPNWFAEGWQCPFLYRPKDCDWIIGRRMYVSEAARMWTGRLVDMGSELYRSRLDPTHLYTIEGVHLTRDYTQVQTQCEVTGMLGWVNVWHRYPRRAARGAGVICACME